MKNIIGTLAIVSAVFAAGCKGAEAPVEQSSPSTANAPAATTVAYDLGSKKKGDKAVCVVCNVTEPNKGEEVVAETIDYNGKTYAFCNEKEKAEFISDPKKFAGR